MGIVGPLQNWEHTANQPRTAPTTPAAADFVVIAVSCGIISEISEPCTIEQGEAIRQRADEDTVVTIVRRQVGELCRVGQFRSRILDVMESIQQAKCQRKLHGGI
jgi:hypothetical protein